MTLNAHTTASQPVIESFSGISQTSSSYIHPVDLHRSLEAVRRMPEFQPPTPSPWNDWLKQPWIQDFTEKIGHQLDLLLKKFAHFLSQLRPLGTAHLPENIRDVFNGFLGFLIVLMALYAFYLVLGWLLSLKERRIADTHPGARLFEETRLINSGAHYQQAQAAADAGQYAEGLRQLYMATLCLFDEHALVSYTVARSNLEYIEHLLQAKHRYIPLVKVAFEQLAKQFEASRYGKKPVNVSQFERSKADYETLLQKVGTMSKIT